MDKDEDDDLSTLLNAKVAEIGVFESAFAAKIETAMERHDHAQNQRRLKKHHEAIRNVEERIARATSTARIAKLVDRLDELKHEEAQLLELIRNKNIAEEDIGALTDALMDPSAETSTSSLAETPIFVPAYMHAAIDIESGDLTSVSLDSPEAHSLHGQDVLPTSNQHAIIDDASDSDFSARVDEWLTCDKFAEWRQHRGFFVNLTLTQQIGCELSCFDTVTLLDGAFRIPRCLWDELFGYQQRGVEWLLRLHLEGHGGVLGDEMGLGKTVQVIAYLAALHISGHLDSPGLVIVPSTLLRQWLREFNAWWPPLRTVLLHASSPAFQTSRSTRHFVMEHGTRTHVFVTSYGTAGSTVLHKLLLARHWAFVVLDEGHKIRNPEAQITLLCKQLQSIHRIGLSGTPIQNNLTELWSLFDFVYPGRLGTLPMFKAELALPINTGGYANASLVQVQTSYKCACVLRDLIRPYLLRRLKRDVLSSSESTGADRPLPGKREEVVFCRITDYQRRLYEAFISSDDVDAILQGRRNVLAGIDVLRKICNHPDLLERHCSENLNERLAARSSAWDHDDDADVTDGAVAAQLTRDVRRVISRVKRPVEHAQCSGKIVVLDRILALWHRQGHRALVFCQTRQMLNLIEEHLVAQSPAYAHLRMDGATPVRQRLQLVDQFNAPTSPFFLFLLTTRVGGLGINLTGADRVVIYDPDWNPSTDLQARERVYRLGQTRPVSILRLITAGTIEEKIYHRQIFKQYLTQRVLDDPKQTRFFRAADLYDLFSLAVPRDDEDTETGALFAGLDDDLQRKMARDDDALHDTRRDRKRQQSDMEDVMSADESQNDTILDSLLDMVGVHSTLSTTQVTDVPRPELLLVENEAERVAQSALAALQRQQPRTRASPLATATDHYNTFKPQWGGRFGAQMQFGGSRTDVDSSATGTESHPCASLNASVPVTASDILEAISKRNRGGALPTSEPASLELAMAIVDYFNRMGGVAESDRVAHVFRGHVHDSETAVLFRSLLRQVAVFNKTTRRWRLRPEFARQ